jgi:quercetin dioxygenase-like cupin family protein
MYETEPGQREPGEKYDVLVGPGGRLGAELLVAPEETESGLAVVEHTLAPGRLGAPRHRHTREDALSLVRSGTMTFLEDGETRRVGPGKVVVKPRGRWHAFWNAGDETLRFYELLAPGAFANYFTDVTPYVTRGELPDESTQAALAAVDDAYGVETDYESIATLIETYRLRP